ncbi:MAG: Cj0069 family protein [Chloroflexota bacterium]
MTTIGRIGILQRGETNGAMPELSETRFQAVYEALVSQAVTVELIHFGEEAVDAVRKRLLQLDALLVWVDPMSDGRDRSVLDPLLREIASGGVFVSTHPDVILKMGTKDVLYDTRHLPWGTDTHLYRSLDQLREQLPHQLRSSGARVLKQHRGNGGNGVWKVKLVDDASMGNEALVRVQHGTRGSRVDQMPFSELLVLCHPYYAGDGHMIDQPYQSRLREGMIRCYLSCDRVVGFGHQYVTALLPPEPGETVIPDPSPRLYYGPEKPEFQLLKNLLENDWVAQMQRTLGIERESLPVIWDADFLLGPKTVSGEDTYVLCEINVSSVSPMPVEAAAPLAEMAVTRMLAAKERRN